MPSKPQSPKKSYAFRRTGTALGLGLALAIGPALAGEAYAFKIFGINFFGEDEAVNDVIDPVRYSVTLETDGADKDLAETLERASLLVQGEEAPVSGDLGLVIKARDDRDRLIATLYENSRYGGVVSVTVNGRDIDDLPPIPTFGHDGPVPVAIRVEPGPAFALGNVA